jgi:hypothetical protein
MRSVPAMVTARVARSSTRALSMEAAVSWTFSVVRLGCSPKVGMIAIVLNLLARDRQSTSSFTPRKLIGQIALLLRVLWLESSSDEPLPLGFAQSLTAHDGDGDGEKEVYRQWTHRGTILVRVKNQKVPVTLDCGSLGNTVSCDNSICKSLEKDYSEVGTSELEVVSDVGSWH